jgi:hypothetical protein
MLLQATSALIVILLIDPLQRTQQGCVFGGGDRAV